MPPKALAVALVLALVSVSTAEATESDTALLATDDAESTATFARDDAKAPGFGYVSMLNPAVRLYSSTRTALSFTGGGSGQGVFSPEAPAPDARSLFIQRVRFDWWLGGGEAGFDGGFEWDFDHGARWPAHGHGFALSGGGVGLIRGNDLYYLSRLEAPHATAAYQYLTEDVLVELAGRGGLLIDGRFRVGDNPSTNAELQPSWSAWLVVAQHPVFASLKVYGDSDLSRYSARLCARFLRSFVGCGSYEVSAEGPSLLGARRRIAFGALSVGLSPF